MEEEGSVETALKEAVVLLLLIIRVPVCKLLLLIRRTCVVANDRCSVSLLRLLLFNRARWNCIVVIAVVVVTIDR